MPRGGVRDFGLKMLQIFVYLLLLLLLQKILLLDVAGVGVTKNKGDTHNGYPQLD